MKFLIIFFVITVTIYVNLTSVLAQEVENVTEILDIKPEVRIKFLINSIVCFKLQCHSYLFYILYPILHKTIFKI